MNRITEAIKLIEDEITSSKSRLVELNESLVSAASDAITHRRKAIMRAIKFHEAKISDLEKSLCYMKIWEHEE